jgi:hypothetical protein
MPITVLNCPRKTDRHHWNSHSVSAKSPAKPSGLPMRRGRRWFFLGQSYSSVGPMAEENVDRSVLCEACRSSCSARNQSSSGEPAG